MAKNLSLMTVLNLLLLAIALGYANSARILIDDDDSPPPVPEPSHPVLTPVTDVAPVVGPVATTQPPTIPQTATVAPQTPMSFFMHDILGGIAPSGRVVTGNTATNQINGLPFSKRNGGVFPINGGGPLLTGLNGGSRSNVINNNNVITNGNVLPFVTAGQLPQTLQNFMFGTITVIDDELTEGHELGSAIIGKAQGFYLVSSLDGSSSHTVALTMLLGDDHEEDTISFFGVHRTTTHESQVAIVGGTGKYENAQGYATIETLHFTNQHTTDGVDTLLHFVVYLSH